MAQLGILILVAMVGWGAFLAYRWLGTMGEVGAMYVRLQDIGELNGDVGQDDFRTAYLRAEGPRFGTYLFVSLLIVTAIFPFFLGLFDLVWGFFWRRSGELPWFEAGELVHSLILAILTVGAMFCFAYVSMRIYHQNRPGSLKSEVRRLNGEAHGD
ncbi:MAG: hypothetical protein AAGJ29_07585 [Pseudomonadota bacterium]